MPKNEHILGLALGKFDGMHLAHKALFAHLPPQSALLCIESKGASLTPYKEPYSPYPIISINFEDIIDWSGAHFMKVLNDKFPSLHTLVVGYDFAFGKDRAYSANNLAHFFNGKIVIMPEFCVNGIGVHSSLIKEYIRNGDMKSATHMLGRFYALRGNIISGQNLGSKALYATINIEVGEYILPQNGVYASFTQLENEILPSVSFIGNRLSTDDAFSVETHILEQNIHTLSDNKASIFFVQKIRDNQKFEHLYLLKEAITQDIAQAKEILRNANKNLIA